MGGEGGFKGGTIPGRQAAAMRSKIPAAWRARIAQEAPHDNAAKYHYKFQKYKWIHHILGGRLAVFLISVLIRIYQT
mgnify:CR=1 FL=1